MFQGLEVLLEEGLSDDPICDLIPPQAEEQNPPVFAKLPNGEWLQWTSTLMFEDNGPSINDENLTAKVIPDGGGAAVLATNERMKCSNVPRSFLNEETCFLSQLTTACSIAQEVGEIEILMTEANIVAFYSYGNRFIYAIRGLGMETIDEHPCVASTSRWTIQAQTTCSAPTQLENDTLLALSTALDASTDTNLYVRDISSGPLNCTPGDVTVGTLGLQIQVGTDCFTNVHADHMNIYDFTEWRAPHPGGAYNIEKWAQGWDGHEGWYLNFPLNGNATRGIPQHPMNRWDKHGNSDEIEYIGIRFGDTILYRDLNTALKVTAIAEYFGAVAEAIDITEGGVVTCGSLGEVENSPHLREVFDVRSEGLPSSSNDHHIDQRTSVWYDIAINGV